MRYEAISLLLLVAPLGSWWESVAAVDIFDGLNDTSKDVKATAPPGKDIAETCVQDLIPDEPLSFTSKANIVIQDALDEMPKTPDTPRLGDLWRELNTIVIQPTIKDKIGEAKKVIEGHRAMVDLFANQWIQYIDKQRHDAIDHIQEVIKEKNQEIKAYFKRHFDEFDGVCMPDEDECLKNIQHYLQQYSEKVAKNTEACNAYADRQLEQHAKWLEEEKKKLGKPFQKLDGCLKAGSNIVSSVLTCIGNTVTSSIQFGLDAAKSFGATMQRAAASITGKLAKYKECVVDRKKLLDGGQRNIAAKAKACLRKQQPGGAAGAGAGELFTK